MFITRILQQLKTAPEFLNITSALAAGDDATFAVSQSARPLMMAALWSMCPRPAIYICAGEDQADRVARSLGAWIDPAQILRYPDRKDLPWQDKPAVGSIIGQRAVALSALSQGLPCIVVCSAKALLRRVPPVAFFASQTYEIGDEVAPSEVADRLIAAGYAYVEGAGRPGTFYIHGDALDVYPSQLKNPVRLEFFGDEIDRIRTIVASTGQTIQDIETIEIMPARELALTPETIGRARKALWQRAQEDSRIAADLELIEAASANPELEVYLEELYGSTASPLDHISSDSLVCLSEPKSLFDECLHAYQDLEAQAQTARIACERCFTPVNRLDFKENQRLNFVSLLLAGAKPTATLKCEQPAIAGNNTKFIARIRELLDQRYAICFAVPHRQTREFIETALQDEHIPFCESLVSATENTSSYEDASNLKPLNRTLITFSDMVVPAGTVVPDAKLAILSISDMEARFAKHNSLKRIDPTEVTFPYKPGDYVVHATHGIALFKEIVSKEFDGKLRDYFLLEYAQGDKLFVPLERADKITRYVGPDSSQPRLTRLNTADWSRATTKARKSAKKLAFDLVDLYTRRSSVLGYAFEPDTAEQREMEASFSYDLTPDQASALIDIKADMEARKPMDRLLCGDVGFGKTEVALRAAFKCAQDGKQVMVLCPTTILAEQHFETFYERFAPFDKEVGVLSRFVTPAQQRKTLQAFATGKLDVLVGTHRLLSSDVNPKNLGLVIIDEEQRFGVQHKEQLKNMREQVDVLTLSATPIPRTMQMALSGVRDMSMIMTPPPGRLPVEVHVTAYDPDLLSEAIRFELARRGQVYFISNRVKTIDEAYERVHEVVPEARIGIAHGKMSPREVEKVMLEFEQKKIDVLIATTIVESGIDNPHTNTLIIEDSQRLGLAQLYQLKGRVGRGRTQAYAYFMFPEEIPLTEEATERLLAIHEHQELGSGMKIAMRDLEIRGAGSLMGAEQHGNLSSVGFDLFTNMLQEAVAEARGEVADSNQPEVQINLNVDYFLSEEYVPEVDKRVLIYRKLACAEDLAYLDDLQKETVENFGEMPEAAQNLFDRARLRIRAQRLGVTSIALVDGRRLVFQDLQVPKEKLQAFKSKGARVFVQSHQLIWPYYPKDGLLISALAVLEEIGGSDEE